ncbi:ATP-binding protein [Meridianimarinicoccus sp. RP-17]|uniref:ATP-binding protein n=1 Tax=Meridianimarinicoccus zhengii TaxID=2056810 RepID=UPI000DABC360|nr:ATP-binding protein [Phycocomes zhengii]
MTAPITRFKPRPAMGDGLADRPGLAARRHVLTVGASPHGVRAALIQVNGVLCADGVGRDDRGTCETVLAEVLNNIVEHAYGGKDDRNIGVVLSRDRRGLVVEVTDAGAPMPGGCLPDPKAAPLDVARDDLPEGGFGWSVIRDLTAGLEYRRVNGINRLRFRVPFGA